MGARAMTQELGMTRQGPSLLSGRKKQAMRTTLNQGGHRQRLTLVRPMAISQIQRPIATEKTEEAALQPVESVPQTNKSASRSQDKTYGRGLTSHLKNLISYSRIPLASKIGTPSSAPSASDLSMVADGMAANLPPSMPTTTAPTSKSSRRWSLTRRRHASTTSAPPAQTPVMVDHAALSVLRERIASGTLPGQRTDNFKLGLVVEGGGMRGCVSGGALQAIAELGIRDAFDAVYGSSAGAINSTFFLSHQKEGVEIYHDHIASPEFIDMKRFWKRVPGQPAALNLEYLINDVMEHRCPLDWDAVINSPVPLKVVASSLDTLEPVLLQDFSSKEDLAECLKASANVPEVAGQPRQHRGHRLVDAAVFEPIPFRSAIADGCTHIICLCTRPIPKRSTLDKALANALQAVVKRYVLSPEYMVPAWEAELESLIKDGLSQDDQLMRSFDEDAHRLPWFAGAHVYPIYPSAVAASFSPLCIDVPTLKAGVAEGRRVTLHTLKAALGGLVDFSCVGLEGDAPPAEPALNGSNTVPLTQLNRDITLERMYKRYGDFSHHD